MADLQPYLQFRLHEHPGLSAYVDSYPAPRPGVTVPPITTPALGNGTQYTYNQNRTPDAYLKTTARPNIYTPLSDDLGLDANHFSATRRANDISTWSVTMEYDGNDPRANELWEAAKNPTAFATMHITDPRDDMDVVNDFMGMDLFGGNIYTSAATPTFGPGLTFPGVLDRGFSGPVLRVSPKRSRDKLEITVQGSCWGKALQQTVHTGVADLTVTQRTGAGLQDLLRSILTWNSEYQVDLFDATDLGTDDAAGSQAWRTAYDRDALTLQGLGRTRTQVAFWGIIFAFEGQIASFLRGNRGTTVFDVREGQHAALRSCQRLAERATGLLFETNLQCMPWYQPGQVERIWAPEDYTEASMDRDRPEASSWLTKHNDYRRDWLVYVIARDLIDQLGEIQVSNQSTAVRPLNFDAEPVVLTETGSDTVDRARTLAASDEAILESIQAQDAGLALYEANRFSAQVGAYWDYPMRFGIDIGMGTAIDLYLNDVIHSDDPMDIRQAAFVWANNTWSQSFGLGSKADVVPRKRADNVSVGR